VDAAAVDGVTALNGPLPLTKPEVVALAVPAGLALAHPRVPLTRLPVVHRTELPVVPGRRDEVRGIVDAVRGRS
jgi:hypothetical protein